MFNMTESEANIELLTAESFADLLPEIDTFIFGGDGPLWLREGVITDMANLANLLIEHKKEVLILTNDTNYSRETHETKLSQHRFNKKLNKDRIITPGSLAANYINDNVKSTKKGINLFGPGPDALSSLPNEGAVFTIDLSVRSKDVCAVVVGLDRHLSFKKLVKAASYIKDTKCLFLAINDNATLGEPNEDVVIPDAGRRPFLGALVAALKKATGREPVILGKPYSPGYEYIKKKWNIDESRTIMICNNINCDVLFGRNHGMRTLLIISNPHELDEMEKMRSSHSDALPHYYITSISTILPQNK
ncbi:HAD hydrolase, family IIA [Ancylostoma duodenale]|uniref:HAD hydrolase, family IIA n=1 Tax=Ancylostoma duodenale TaxID=51022 RepID=A0A0C2F5R0_9BILA|nr:HAD hydrolase, family IIA [Ancylostoma duodenale]